jgi:hypothetical protein
MDEGKIDWLWLQLIGNSRRNAYADLISSLQAIARLLWTALDLYKSLPDEFLDP